MAKVISAAIMAVYSFLLLGTPVMLFTGFITALFGLPAYGLNSFGRIQVGIFIFACVTLPVALLVSVFLSGLSFQKNNWFQTFLRLCIPLPYFMYFVGLLIALIISQWGPLTRHFNPQTAADYYANSRVSRPMIPASRTIEDLNKAIELSDPKSEISLAAHIARAYNYAQAGKNKEAIADYEWFLENKSALGEENNFVHRSAVITSIAILQARLGKYKDALAVIDREIAQTVLIRQIQILLAGRAQIDEAMNDTKSASEDLRMSNDSRKLLVKYPNAQKPERNRSVSPSSKETSIYEMDSFGNIIRNLK